MLLLLIFIKFQRHYNMHLTTGHDSETALS